LFDGRRDQHFSWAFELASLHELPLPLFDFRPGILLILF